ncbi:MAG: helix-turn-helix domain-containing protein [Verrucomicrobiales bacterium]|nr:helix-turn-helix domain-containing protein [Verrucomicrobiales bacterium]
MNPFPKDEPLIPKRELAYRLGKAERTIDYWRRQYGLPCIKVSRSVMFRYSAVLRFLEKNAGKLGFNPRAPRRASRN